MMKPLNRFAWKWRLLIVAAAVIAYAPCLNNGFIADDFILLNRVEILKTNPWYLIEVTPEPFRLTSYIALGILKALFGYDYLFYYAFCILLHAINSLLLAEIVVDIVRKFEV